MSLPAKVLGHLRSLLVVSVSSWFVVPKRLRVVLLRAAGMRIGADVLIQYGSRFRTVDVTIGDVGYIQQECLFAGLAPITIGSRVFIGSRTHIETTTHVIGPPEHRCAQLRDLPVTIGDGTWIGSGTMVMPGVTIGAGCVIAAGAVVTRDCEPNGLYAGVPAVRKRDLDATPSALAVAALV